MATQPRTKSAARAPRQQQQAGERTRLIRLVHVGRRDLNLDDGAYRAILQAQGGAESSAHMSVPQLQRVVDYLKRQGFRVATKAKTAQAGTVVVKARRTGLASANAVVLASDPESRKARAMWLTLHAIGQVRDPSEAALLAYAKRQTGIDRLEWTADMVPVLEPLKAWLQRSLPGVVTPYLRKPIDSWAGHMGPVWRQNWSHSSDRLQWALHRGLTQVVDEWVDLWQLIEQAAEGGKQ